MFMAKNPDIEPTYVARIMSVEKGAVPIEAVNPRSVEFIGFVAKDLRKRKVTGHMVPGRIRGYDHVVSEVMRSVEEVINAQYYQQATIHNPKRR